MKMKTSHRIGLPLALIAWVSFAAVSAQGQETEVLSDNIIGYATLTVSSNLTMLAMPFDVDDASVQFVLGTNRVDETDPWRAGTTFGNADVFYVWQPDGLGGGAFLGCYLKTNTAAGASSRNRWYDINTLQPSTHRLLPGQGLFLQSAVATDRYVTVTGDVVMDPAVTNRLVQGLNLVSYPYAVARDVQALAFSNAGAKAGTTVANADQIMVWDADNGAYVTLLYRTNTGAQARHFKWIDVRTLAVWSNSIAPGQSFWYRRVLTNNMDWIEARPY